MQRAPLTKEEWLALEGEKLAIGNYDLKELKVFDK